MRVLRAAFCVLMAAACATVSDDSPERTVDEFLAALGAGDANIGELFTSDATMFLPLNDSPLRANGREEIAALFVTMFNRPGYKGGVPKAEDLRVERIGGGALVTFQLKNPNVTSRRTFVLRRAGGRWRIAHLHGSNIRKD